VKLKSFWRQAATLAVLMLVSTSALARGRGLTLEQAVRRALASPRALAARQAVAQARAELRSASLLPNPTLSVEASLLPLSRRYTVEEPGGPTELSAGLSFPVDRLLFGKRAAAMRSAAAGVEVAAAELADLRRLRASETAQVFFGVLEAEALLEAARQAVQELEQVEEVTARAARSGGRPQVELNRVRLELQAARREERQVAAAVVAGKASLLALLGSTGSPARLELAGSLDGPLAARPLSVGAAYAIAEKDRPDILALRKKLLKARQDLVVERRGALPETSVALGVAHQFQRSIGAPDVTAWGASLEIALPIFDRNQGNRSKSASAGLQAELELKAALAELRAEVEQAVQALGVALQNAQSVAQNDLGLARQVRDSFRKAYEAGGRSLLELLDAQRNYRETYRAFISTRAEYRRSLARYRATLGKVAP
jgi:cobalt-zinc-cadmium efflux system outer membrane protein